MRSIYLLWISMRLYHEYSEKSKRRRQCSKEYQRDTFSVGQGAERREAPKVSKRIPSESDK
jgi:hypothetical protein